MARALDGPIMRLTSSRRSRTAYGSQRRIPTQPRRCHRPDRRRWHGEGGMTEVSGSIGTCVDSSVGIASRAKARAVDTRQAACWGLVAAALLTMAGTVRLGAQVPTQAAVPEELSQPVYEGPPPPSLPETIARAADGGVTVRAVRVSEPLRVDGVLDEQVYQDILPAGGFIQTEPSAGLLATEQTDIWILFDDDNLYISARCWDSAPESEWVANEMRRDNLGIFQGTTASASSSTPSTTAATGSFSTSTRSAAGWTARCSMSGVSTQIGIRSWETRAGRFEGGWTVEMAIPFKSMRYRPGRAQVWGLNVRRSVRHG